MNRLTQILARLYPASWRKRYEAEFNALLEDVNPDWRTSLDILQGAIVMQLRTVSFGTMVALTGLIGLMLGLGIWVVIPDQYASTAILKIQPLRAIDGPVSEKAIADHINIWAHAILTRPSLAEIVQKYRLYQAKEKVPLDDILTEMKNNIEIRPAGRDGVVVQFCYFDRPLARRVASELVNKLVDASHESTVAGSLFDLGILDPANLPERPVSPNPKPLAIVGLLAGLIVGLSFALFCRSPKPV